MAYNFTAMLYELYLRAPSVFANITLANYLCRIYDISLFIKELQTRGVTSMMINGLLADIVDLNSPKELDWFVKATFV